MNRITLVLLLISVFSTSYGLFEDQAGKFDWHQKYFGHVRFLLNDVNQPKRIIVGTGDNIVGAINSKTGDVLYRHVLEADSTLLHLGNFGSNHILTVSSRENQVKVRTYKTSNGVETEEWTVKQSADYATEFNGLLHFIDPHSEFPNLLVSSYNLKNKKDEPVGDGEDEDDSNGMQNLGSKKMRIGLERVQHCETVPPYLVCANGKEIAILHLEDSTLTLKTLDFEVAGISGTGSKLTAVAFKGKDATQIFQIVKNAGSEAVLVPVPYPPTAKYVSLSQTIVENNPVLFITRLKSPHEIQMDAFCDKLERLDAFSLHVTSENPIAPFAVTKGYCFNTRCGLVGFTTDEVLFGTKLDESHTEKVEVKWTREESLASTVAVETVDYPSETEQSWNPYSTQQGVVGSFLSRIIYEVDTIFAGDKFYASSSDRFGVKKVIVFVTAIGKVVGMDGLSGQILYSFLLPDFKLFKDSSAFLYLQRPAKYAPLKPLASVLYSSFSQESTVLFAFNPIEGKPLDKPQVYPPILQAQNLLHGSEETKFLKPVVLLDRNNVVHTYPPGVKELQNLYFFIGEKSSQPLLKGFAVKKDPETDIFRASLLWSLSLGNSELIGIHSKLPCEKIHSQGRVLPDRSVSYKYMNPNLIAVVTAEHEAGNVNVFLVDGVSGAVIHSLWHKKSKGPVHMVHTEHWMVYSLFNEKFRRYEITSIELYEGQKQSNSTAFSSFAAPTVQPLLIKQSYILPSKIDFMAYTRTEKGITNKDILMALPTGGILELPKFVMQPRLSAQHHQIHQDEDGVIHSVPYIPELPMPAEMIINYNQSVKRVRGIKTWPTRLESTCLVLVYGVDIFYTKVAPSKHFDVLKDDFDHWFIFVVLLGLCIGAYVTKRLSARKTLEQAWR